MVSALTSAAVGRILRVAHKPSMCSIKLVAPFLAFSEKDECIKNDGRVMIVSPRIVTLSSGDLGGRKARINALTRPPGGL